MSIRLMSLVWQHYPGGGGELLLALGIADHSHDDGTRIYPSVRHLAHKTRQSERAVQYQLRDMESAKWLERMSSGYGGRGRATEYRINPAWIQDPENFAPLLTVQKPDKKDAKYSHKGRNDLAPQPPESSETTTTTTPPQVVGATAEVDADVVVVPDFFKGHYKQSALTLLKQCPNEHQQDVLDEVAGFAAKGRLRGDGISLLSKLVKEAAQGRFVLNHALAYRQNRIQHAARTNAEQSSQIPASRETARAHLSQIMAQFGEPRSPEATSSEKPEGI